MTANAPRRGVSNGVLGMTLFILAETMMFAGLISAFTIVRRSALGGIWPPPGQPRLPADETLINTIALVLSGLVVFAAGRAFARKPDGAAKPLMIIGFVLGTFFVGFQGVEWVAMLREGLTLTSSTHGAFFYLVVGIHGLHAVAALMALAVVVWRLYRGTLNAVWFKTARLFWYFVVGLWPVLYWRVYL